MKRFLVQFLLSFILLVLVGTGMSSCVVTQFRQNDRVLSRHLKKKKSNFELGYYDAIGRRIRYLIIDNGAKDNLVLLHGAPGSMSRYRHYLDDSTLRSHYNFYIIDRPGYGYSGFGKAETSIDKQVEALRPLFDKMKDTCCRNFIFGKSYGGPIAARFAMKYPELVDGLVLVAPAIQPGEEKIYPISYFMVKKSLGHLFPSMYVTASLEKLGHASELREMNEDWNLVHCPVIMVQGLKDKLIYPTNIIYLEKNLNDSLLRVVPMPDETHFFSKKAFPGIIDACVKIGE
jgi:pimeloyl-ACP methyl ester carboxylesterase